MGTEQPGTLDYDQIGGTYARFRRADPRIAQQIAAALGDAHTVLNVGAGAGSYEPSDRLVVGVEPSRTMIRQRPAGAAPVVRSVAERLPFADRHFDAALAVFTIHHWSDVARGFDELERIASLRVFLTWDRDVHWRYWLFEEYLPEIRALERAFPAQQEILSRFPGSRVDVVPVPWDCTDGFCTAYWRRPEQYLDPDVRAGVSSFARLAPDVVERALRRLQADLDSGVWEGRHRDLLDREWLDCGLRLVVSPDADPSRPMVASP